MHAPPQCSASPPTAIVIEMMPVGLLILDVVVRPRMLAVVERALAVPSAILRVEDRPPRLDDGDAHAGTELGEPLGEHRGGDAAADDADVGFVDGHESSLG